jgi:CHAD domain-containing protein
MNDFDSGQVLLADALRSLIAVIRETRQRVLTSEAFHLAASTTDEEAVHDFRVALRRCRTVLRVARNIWSTKQIKRLENELGYFASATGSLRDDEVLRTTLTSLALSDVPRDEILAWLERRTIAGRTNHRRIMRILRDGPPRRDAFPAKGKPLRALDIVLDKLEMLIDEKATTACTAEELTRTSLDNAIRDVRRTAQPDVSDAPAMHTLRIREKRLRYTAELFANQLEESGRRLVSHATRLQRRLGELHDFDEAMATVARARGLTKDTRQAIIAALRVARVACAVKVAPHLIEARGLVAPIVLSRSDSLPNVSA